MEKWFACKRSGNIFTCVEKDTAEEADKSIQKDIKDTVIIPMNVFSYPLRNYILQRKIQNAFVAKVIIKKDDKI